MFFGIYPGLGADAIGGVEMSDVNDARLDKWLWMVRLFKTRALATEACRAGRVMVDGREAKPALGVRPGQLVEVKDGLLLRRRRVLGVPPGRRGAASVGEYARDETPPELEAEARERRVQHILAGGGVRPTKRDRRAREALDEIPDPSER